jgi:hypothetical protein
MASLASYDDFEGTELFLRYPPPPFGCNSVAGERRSIDTDKDWLPDVQDMLSGNFNVFIGDSDHEVGLHLHKIRIITEH